ncbi:MAG: hydrogenase nickel incorporation protein HypA [Puniceicoccaceae bacterium MED-G32]|nr:hydrogenase nickel incorporation protein HypA [Puniceicoccaceae bacterium]PDH25860.1 MAG: hydrogenase nickel incorporation protein HypA [Puniceicoccaceae bacterium MED-G32]
MIYIPFEIFSLILIILGLSIILALWFYYDRKQKLAFKKEKFEKAFYCIKCNHLYSIRQNVELSDCPKCGYESGRLQF